MRPRVVAKAQPVAIQPQPDDEIYLDEADVPQEIEIDQSETEPGGFSGPIRTDQHAQLAGAIVNGTKALKQKDASSLLSNLQTLGKMGATPREQTLDLIKQWARDYARISGKKASIPEGPGYGPTYWRIELAPGETVRASNEYFSGMISEVTIVPLAGEDVALTVAGRRNKSVCNVTATEGQMKTCEWTPKFSAAFNSTITNQGKSSAIVYVIFT